MFQVKLPWQIALTILIALLWLFTGFGGCSLQYDRSELKTKEKGEWKLVPIWNTKK